MAPFHVCTVHRNCVVASRSRSSCPPWPCEVAVQRQSAPATRRAAAGISQGGVKAPQFWFFLRATRGSGGTRCDGHTRRDELVVAEGVAESEQHRDEHADVLRGGELADLRKRTDYAH
jgi:hypothetical protein